MSDLEDVEPMDLDFSLNFAKENFYQSIKNELSVGYNYFLSKFEDSRDVILDSILKKYDKNKTEPYYRLKGVLKYIANVWKYRKDKVEQVQRVETSISTFTGDCEDISIFVAAIIAVCREECLILIYHAQHGINGHVLLALPGNGPSDKTLNFKYKNKNYVAFEPQTAGFPHYITKNRREIPDKVIQIRGK